MPWLSWQPCPTPGRHLPGWPAGFWDMRTRSTTARCRPLCCGHSPGSMVGRSLTRDPYAGACSGPAQALPWTPFSSTVLVLNLILPGDGPAAATLAANAAAGLPARLTLGQVRHHLDTERSRSASTPGSVFVCENPTVIEAAAESLGPGAAPLICIEGRPSVAAILLLQELRNDGSQLRYHGDFDWPGVGIATTIIGLGAASWRFGAADYREGLISSSRPKPLPSPTGQVQTPWDHSLAQAMLDHRLAVEEETVMDGLIADLTVG